MKILNEYKTELFAIYWGRWMLSAFVMMPFMIIFEIWSIPLWANLIIGQTIGAIIFFKIDKMIFNGKESATVKEEFDAAKEAMDTVKDF